MTQTSNGIKSASFFRFQKKKVPVLVLVLSSPTPLQAFFFAEVSPARLTFECDMDL